MISWSHGQIPNHTDTVFGALQGNIIIIIVSCILKNRQKFDINVIQNEPKKLITILLDQDFASDSVQGH